MKTYIFTIALLTPLFAGASVANINSQTAASTPSSTSINSRSFKSKTSSEMQPTIDVTQSLEEEAKASEEFSAQALTYRDLYRDNISIAQKWGILKNLRTKDPDFAKKTYMSCIQSTDWFLRLGGVKFLATLDKKTAIKEAQKLLLEDEALLVRSGAADVLMRNGLYHAKESFWQALKDQKNFYRGQSLWIRRNIAQALKRATDKSENPKWSQFLDDKDEKVKASAVAALEKNNQMVLGQAEDSLDEKAYLWKEKLLAQSQFIGSDHTSLVPKISSPSLVKPDMDIDQQQISSPVQSQSLKEQTQISKKKSQPWDLPREGQSKKEESTNLN